MNHHVAPPPGAPAVALKHDAGKVPLHLVDPAFLDALAQVLEFGARKYAAWNWAKGTFAWSRLYGALQRHLNAFWEGEELDPETKLPHLWHAACCLMFLVRYHKSGWGEDDRYRFDEVTPAGKADDWTDWDPRQDDPVGAPRVAAMASGVGLSTETVNRLIEKAHEVNRGKLKETLG